jgi:hypothetical protein
MSTTSITSVVSTKFSSVGVHPCWSLRRRVDAVELASAAAFSFACAQHSWYVLPRTDA